MKTLTLFATLLLVLSHSSSCFAADCDECNVVIENGRTKAMIGSESELIKKAVEKYQKEKSSNSGGGGSIGYGGFSIGGSASKGKHEEIMNGNTSSLSDRESKSLCAEYLGKDVLDAWVRCLELCSKKANSRVSLDLSTTDNVYYELAITWDNPYATETGDQTTTLTGFRMLNFEEATTPQALKSGLVINRLGKHFILKRSNQDAACAIIIETPLEEGRVCLPPLLPPAPQRDIASVENNPSETYAPTAKPSESVGESVRNIYYLVTTKTHNGAQSKTDDKLYISLNGSKGKITSTRLDNTLNNFEKGKKDYFLLKKKDIGDLKSIDIKIVADKKGGPINDWFGDSITITKIDTTKLAKSELAKIGVSGKVPKQSDLGHYTFRVGRYVGDSQGARALLSLKPD